MYAVRFQLDGLNKEFNALNKEIATVRKVRTLQPADTGQCQSKPSLGL